MGQKSTIAIVAISMIMLGLASGAWAGTVVVDGRVTASDGYSITKMLDFKVEGVGTMSGAKMYLAPSDSNGDFYVAFSMPLDVIDVSYGANAIGWPGGNHKFKHLIGSDKATFEINDTSGDTIMGFTVDFWHGFGHKKGDPPFRSGDVTDGDGKVDTGDKAHFLAGETSGGYNYNTFGVSHPKLFGKDKSSPAADSNYNVVDPALAGWVFEMVYEFKISGDALAGADFDLMSDSAVLPTELHLSPHKLDGKAIGGFVVTTVVPLPSGVWAGMSLMGAMLLLRAKRRKLAIA